MGAESFHKAPESNGFTTSCSLVFVVVPVRFEEHTDMVVLRLAVLLQGLLLAARCEVRARDPELEEEDELKDMSDGGGWDHRVPLVGFGDPRHGQGLNRQSPDVHGSVHHPLGHGRHDPTPGHLSPDVPEGTGDPSDPSTRGSLLRTG